MLYPIQSVTKLDGRNGRGAIIDIETAASVKLKKITALFGRHLVRQGPR